jgi:acyl-coenzyme A thioesterase PaaI-like protein
MPSLIKETLFLRAFGWTKVPLIFYCAPSVVELTDERAVVRIPHTRRTINHLRSLYFGTLCVGADVAGGLMAMRLIQKAGNQVNLVFKDFHAEFLKRAEGDTHFTCTDGQAVRAAVERALVSGERENIPVHVVATTPRQLGEEPVARFTLTLSLKRKGERK